MCLGVTNKQGHQFAGKSERLQHGYALFGSRSQSYKWNGKFALYFCSIVTSGKLLTLCCLMFCLVQKQPFSFRGHIWSRIIIDLCHVDRKLEALRRSEEALKDPCVDGEDRLFIQQKCSSLCVPPRRHVRPKFPTLREAGVLKIELSLRKGVGGTSLEDRVLDYLLSSAETSSTDDWHGAHCENGCVLTLFSLLCWPILFHDDQATVNQTFLTPFANCPFDLTSRDFLKPRKGKNGKARRR